jgi:hypothetical protein
VVLEWFEAATAAAAAPLRPVLGLVRSLYALWAVHTNVAFFRCVALCGGGVDTKESSLCL